MFGIMLLLPIFASLVAGLFGRGIGIKGTNAVVLISLFISTLLALVLGYEVILGGSSVSLRLGSWFDTGSNGMIDWAFVLDPLGAWLTGTVLVISFLVHIFATSYMSADPSPQRFMCLLVAFTASMVLLVTGDSLGILFLGWELIGITSFLLIGYWWDRASACNAAVQALIINRVGDCSFTLALMLLLTTAGTLDLSTLVLWMNFLLGSTLDDSWLIGVSWIGVFLVIAAFGKSAQFLLHTWLPRSMDGWRCFTLIKPYFIKKRYFSLYGEILKENSKRCIMIRDKKGRPKGEDHTTLSKVIKDAITGDLLGDGHLGVSSRASRTYNKAYLAFTFSTANLPLLLYLKNTIYVDLCTTTPPNPYPNPLP